MFGLAAGTRTESRTERGSKLVRLRYKDQVEVASVIQNNCGWTGLKPESSSGRYGEMDAQYPASRKP